MPTTEAEARRQPFVMGNQVPTNARLQFSPSTSAINPATLTAERAQNVLGLPAGYDSELKLNRRLYYGDAWLGGAGYIGPWPTPRPGSSAADQDGIARLQAEIMRGFTPVNKVAEVIGRHTGGVVGYEPRWTFTSDGIRVRIDGPFRETRRALRPAPPPPRVAADGSIDRPPPPPTPQPDPKKDAERAAIDKLNSRLTKWWDDRNVYDALQEFVRKLLYGRIATWRLYIPRSYLVDETNAAGEKTGRKLLTVTDADDALSKIHLETVDGDEGRVVRDPETLQDVGIRISKSNDGSRTVVDFTYVDEQGKTVVAVIDGTKPAARLPLDMGGRLLMHTAYRDPFITEAVRAAQYALNYANSTIPRNVTTSGFMETMLANVELNGKFVEDPAGGPPVFVAPPIARGPGIMPVFTGIKTEDANGAEQIATPVIHDRQPVDPEPTIKAKREHYRDILEGTDQGHVLITGEATPSGRSREQSRKDFLSSLKTTQPHVERALRWLLETVAVFAEALAAPASRPTILDGLRASASCFLDAGPVEAAERAQNTLDVGAGTLSAETAIERNNIIDVDAELQRIDESRAVDLETKRAVIFKSWIDAGADEAYAAWRAGLSDTEAARLLAGFAPPPPPDPNAGNGNGNGDGNIGGGDGNAGGGNNGGGNGGNAGGGNG